MAELRNLINISISAQPTAVVEYSCNPDDLQAETTAILGGIVSRTFTMPIAFPYFGGYHMYAWKVDPKPMFGDRDWNQEILLEVHFKVPEHADYDPASPNPLQLFSWSFQAASQAVTLPKGNYTWGDGTKLNEKDTEIVKWIPQGELVAESQWLPALKTKTLMDYAGKVNANAFTVPNDETHAAETVLFHSVNGQQVTTTEGVRAATRTLNFLVNPNGWNKLFRASTGNYETITPSPFASADFTALYT